MKICLLIADEREYTADLLIAEMRRRNVPCVRWNLDRFPAGSSLTYRADQDTFAAELMSDGRRVNLNDVASIWCRNLNPAGFALGMTDADQRFAATEARRMLTSLMTIGKFHWINHPHNNLRANAKPAQLFAARHIGLEIPTTLISNDPAEVQDFIQAQEGEVVYKALSQSLQAGPGKNLFTGIVTRDEVQNLHLIRSCPGIFQARVPKRHELRVTVVGDQIFSAKIDSQASVETALDWRHAPFSVEEDAVELPEELVPKILKIMGTFGLSYGALDFIVTPDGRFIFLEINPAGQYMWVETGTGLPITQALANALHAPCRA